MKTLLSTIPKQNIKMVIDDANAKSGLDDMTKWLITATRKRGFHANKDKSN